MWAYKFIERFFNPQDAYQHSSQYAEKEGYLASRVYKSSHPEGAYELHSFWRVCENPENLCLLLPNKIQKSHFPDNVQLVWLVRPIQKALGITE